MRKTKDEMIDGVSGLLDSIMRANHEVKYDVIARHFNHDGQRIHHFRITIKHPLPDDQPTGPPAGSPTGSSMDSVLLGVPDDTN